MASGTVAPVASAELSASRAFSITCRYYYGRLAMGQKDKLGNFTFVADGPMAMENDPGL